MEETIRFCPNLVCKFYKVFPDGDSDIVAESCPFCEKLLIAYKPIPFEEIILVSEPSPESIQDNDTLSCITDTTNPPIFPTSDVTVNFYTAILRDHFRDINSISLKLKHSRLTHDHVQSITDQERHYEKDTYVLVHFSHRFTSQALEFKDGEMKIPYKYYLDGNKEGFFLDISFTHRVLTLHSSDFSSHNKIIHKYDFIISPANLPLEKTMLNILPARSCIKSASTVKKEI